jgi:protein-arginine kinase activator protein McsA
MPIGPCGLHWPICERCFEQPADYRNTGIAIGKVTTLLLCAPCAQELFERFRGRQTDDVRYYVERELHAPGD